MKGNKKVEIQQIFDDNTIQMQDDTENFIDDVPALLCSAGSRLSSSDD